MSLLVSPSSPPNLLSSSIAGTPSAHNSINTLDINHQGLAVAAATDFANSTAAVVMPLLRRSTKTTKSDSTSLTIMQGEGEGEGVGGGLGSKSNSPSPNIISSELSTSKNSTSTTSTASTIGIPTVGVATSQGTVPMNVINAVTSSSTLTTLISMTDTRSSEVIPTSTSTLTSLSNVASQQRPGTPVPIPKNLNKLNLKLFKSSSSQTVNEVNGNGGPTDGTALNKTTTSSTTSLTLSPSTSPSAGAGMVAGDKKKANKLNKRQHQQPGQMDGEGGRKGSIGERALDTLVENSSGHGGFKFLHRKQDSLISVKESLDESKNGVQGEGNESSSSASNSDSREETLVTIRTQGKMYEESKTPTATIPTPTTPLITTAGMITEEPISIPGTTSTNRTAVNGSGSGSGSRKRTSSRFSPAEALQSVIGAVRTRRPSSRTRTLSTTTTTTNSHQGASQASTPPNMTSTTLEDQSPSSRHGLDEREGSPSRERKVVTPVPQLPPDNNGKEKRRERLRRSSRAMSIESNLSEKSRRSETPLPSPAKLIKKSRPTTNNNISNLQVSQQQQQSLQLSLQQENPPSPSPSPSRMASGMIKLGLGLPPSPASNSRTAAASTSMEISTSNRSNKSKEEQEAEEIRDNRAQALSILEGAGSESSSVRGTLGDSDEEDNDIAVDDAEDEEVEVGLLEEEEEEGEMFSAMASSGKRDSVTRLAIESGLPIIPRVRRKSSSNQGSAGKGKARELAGVMEVPDWLRVGDFIKKELGRGCLNRMGGVAIGGNQSGMRKLEKEEKELWNVLGDGVVAIRLLIHIAPQLRLSPPDRRDLPMARRANINNFIRATVALGIPNEDRFELEDFEGRRGTEGWDMVLKCFLALEKWRYEFKDNELKMKSGIGMETEDLVDLRNKKRESERSSVEFPRSDEEHAGGSSWANSMRPPIITSSSKMVRARNSIQEPSSSSGTSSRLSWERSSTEGRPDSRMSQVTATTSVGQSSISVAGIRHPTSVSRGQHSDFSPAEERDREVLTSSSRRLRVSIHRTSSQHGSRSPYTPPISPVHSPNRPSPLRILPEPAQGPSVTFAPEVDSPPSRKSLGGSTAASPTRVYGDRRMSESAIDILSRVDESEEATSGNSSPKRNPSIKKSNAPRMVALPKRAMSMSPPTYASRSPPPPSPLSNFKFPRSRQNLEEDNSDSQSTREFGRPRSGSGTSPVRNARTGLKPRQRHSSDIGGSRPTTPTAISHSPSMLSFPSDPMSFHSPPSSRSHSPAKRFSGLSSSAEASLNPVVNRNSNGRVPFPRAASESPSSSTNGNGGRERLGSRANQIRPREHKRWNSELYLDLPLASGRDKEPITPLRSRHDSIQPEDLAGRRPQASSRSRSKSQRRYSEQAMSGDERGRIVNQSRRVSNAATRQKLVIREPGQKPVTYQLGENIGRGQFGSVYRALNLNSGRVVAVKRIKLEDRTEVEIRQLTHEVDVLRSLSHISVVKYEGFLRSDHYFNIVMEYVENGSLLHTIKAFGNLPEGLAANYTFKILEGLHYLHSKKVVHCDLKAANILTTKNGNIKLSDFGVSLNMNAVQKTSKQADATGTPNWMAPEIIQLRGSTPKSDIWSLGCTIIELISGRPPYGEMQPLSAMFRIVEDPYPPLPECSIELRDFLISCFAKEPDDRPSAEELSDHAWVSRTWDGTAKMTHNPLDSVPLTRRLSGDAKRFEVIDLHQFAASTDDLVASSPHPTSLLESTEVNPTLATLPSVSLPRLVETLPSPTMEFQQFPQTKYVGAMRAVSGPPTPLLSHSAPSDSSRYPPPPSSSDALTSTDTSDYVQPHGFVKTTFSKPIDCRLCRKPVRKHALLCESCGLICHSSCSEFAPLPCDLRAAFNKVRDSPIIPQMPPSPSLIPSKFNLGIRPRMLKMSFSNRSADALPMSSSTSPPKYRLPTLLGKQRDSKSNGISVHNIGSSTSIVSNMNLSVQPMTEPSNASEEMAEIPSRRASGAVFDFAAGEMSMTDFESESQYPRSEAPTPLPNRSSFVPPFLASRQSLDASPARRKRDKKAGRKSEDIRGSGSDCRIS